MSLFSEKESVSLAVEGMHCEKCVARVTEALEGVAGVTRAIVDLEGCAARVEGHAIDRDALAPAVKTAGFEARLL